MYPETVLRLGSLEPGLSLGMPARSNSLRVPTADSLILRASCSFRIFTQRKKCSDCFRLQPSELQEEQDTEWTHNIHDSINHPATQVRKRSLLETHDWPKFTPRHCGLELRIWGYFTLPAMLLFDGAMAPALGYIWSRDFSSLGWAVQGFQCGLWELVV